MKQSAKTSKTKQTKTKKQNTKNHRKNKPILTHYNNNHTHNDFPPTMFQNRRQRNSKSIQQPNTIKRSIKNMKLQIATHKNIINVDLPETQINEFIIKIKQAEKDYKRKQKEKEKTC